MAAVMKKAFNLETQSNENYVDVPKIIGHMTTLAFYMETKFR